MFGRHAARQLPLLLLAPLAAVALAPLVRGPMFASADGLFHLYRLVEFDRDIRAGILYPRWAPDLLGGYGYPIFIFYAPLLYYLGELFHLLGLGFVNALKATVAAGMLASTLGMYLFGRDLWGRWGGLLSAVAYLYVPYRFVNTYLDGELAQTLAWAWLPWLCWAGWRYLRTGRLRFAVTACLCYAGLIYTHSVASWLATLFLGAALVGVLLLRRCYWRETLRLVGFLGLGAGLAAPYWLPALAEQSFVQLDRVRIASYDFHTNLVPLGRTLSLDWAHGYATYISVNGPAQLGLLQTVVAAAGLLAVASAVAGSSCRRIGLSAVALFTLLAGLSFALMLSPAAGFWERVPFGHFLQFPDRLLWLMAFCLAVLAGGSSVLLRRLPAWLAFPGGALLVAALMYGAAAKLAVSYVALPADLTPRDAVQYEQLSQTFGTTAKGEFTPRWLGAPPLVSPLSSGYVTSPDSARQLAGAQTAGDSPEDWRFQMSEPSPIHVSLPVAYFPGWAATVNGAAVATTPDARGQIQVQIPAGPSQVELRFGATTDRRVADILVLAALGALIAAVAGRIMREKGEWLRMARWDSLRAATGTLSLGVLALLLLVWPGKLSLSNWPAGRPMRMPFGDAGVTLLGADLSQAADTLNVSIALRADGSTPAGIGATVKLLTVDSVWASASQPLPSSVGPSGALEHLDFALPVAAGTPAGSYALELDLERPDGSAIQHGMPLLSFGAPVVGPVKLGMVTVPAASAPIPGQPPTNADFGPLRLTAWQAPERIQQGDFVPLDFWWQPVQAPTGDWLVSVKIADDKGTVWAGHDGPPREGYNPTLGWQSSQLQRDVQMVFVPGGVPPGDYNVLVSWYEPGTLAAIGPQSVLVGRIHVVQSSRADVSKLGIPSPFDHHFANGLELLGFDMPASVKAGQPLPLRLFWRVERAPGSGVQLSATFAGQEQSLVLPNTDQWRAGELIETRVQLAAGAWSGTGQLTVDVPGGPPAILPQPVSIAPG